MTDYLVVYRYTVTLGFNRDRLTWVVYVVAGWFAYLQASPGLVVVHLRDELGLSYSVGGLHVAAFAAGSTAAGVISTRLERWLGRRRLLWSAVVVLAAGVIGLTAGCTAGVTVGSVLIMGIGGGLVLVTIQAVLADHHGEHRTVALAEENVAASIAYLVLIGTLSVAAALQLGWRVALLASLVIPLLRGSAAVGSSLRRRPRHVSSVDGFPPCSGSRPQCCSVPRPPNGASPLGVRPSSRMLHACRPTPRSR